MAGCSPVRWWCTRRCQWTTVTTTRRQEWQTITVFCHTTTPTPGRRRHHPGPTSRRTCDQQRRRKWWAWPCTRWSRGSPCCWRWRPSVWSAMRLCWSVRRVSWMLRTAGVRAACVVRRRSSSPTSASLWRRRVWSSDRSSSPWWRRTTSSGRWRRLSVAPLPPSIICSPVQSFRVWSSALCWDGASCSASAPTAASRREVGGQRLTREPPVRRRSAVSWPVSAAPRPPPASTFSPPAGACLHIIVLADRILKQRSSFCPRCCLSVVRPSVRNGCRLLCYWSLIESRILAFKWHKNRWSWKVIMHYGYVSRAVLWLNSKS